jgi:hypothetical protein
MQGLRKVLQGVWQAFQNQLFALPKLSIGAFSFPLGIQAA